MIIWRFKPEGCTNFGDALNDYLWPRLVDPALTSIPDAAFYGIGTVLGGNMSQAKKHIVFGAGAGYAGDPVVDENWKIYFVRGPRTARAVSHGAKYITDPGILLYSLFPDLVEPVHKVSFMPRWSSMSPELVESCKDANIHVIDPRGSVPDVVRDIKQTKLLLTEALHGAVAADTFGVPWVSIYADRGHEVKWYDWCGSMQMVWNPIDMATFTLSWARDYAVPQLSARSVLQERLKTMKAALNQLNRDIREKKL